MTLHNVLNASLHAGVSNHVHIKHVGTTITIASRTKDDSLTTEAKYHMDHPSPMITLLNWSPRITEVSPIIVRTPPRITTHRANHSLHRKWAKANI
ncbi:hypothetical protein DPMN_112554 [Dreissena polymorpha]|uniref:Uncharacterized protein n=1 Tax=Dreissena polymorpha TaxID=45954 RepID=A0A9D4QPV2_DREPO|nr:hypothetical protein DPMN_112554 [Dreissena polymorpha]